MLGNRTTVIFLLVWLFALGAAPVILKSSPPPVPPRRPEPIEVEPETFTSMPGLASLD